MSSATGESLPAASHLLPPPLFADQLSTGMDTQSSLCQAHLTDLPDNGTVCCHFKSAGCPAKLQKSDFMTHVNKCGFRHKQEYGTELSEHEVADTKRRMEVLRIKCLEIENEMQELEKRRLTTECSSGIDMKKKEELKNENEMLRKKIEVMERNGQTLQKQVASCCEKLIKLEEELNNGAKKDDLIAQKREITDLRSSQENQLSCLNSLDSGIGSADHVTEEMIENHHRNLQLASMSLHDYDSRVQHLLADTSYGKLVWRIKEYWQKKGQTSQSDIRYIQSPYFKTSKYGYKMCLRVFLNGESEGRGSHISLFFVLVMGEYDPLLPWPFRQRVTLKILDQAGDDHQHCHIVDSFRGEPSKRSFKRPGSDTNINVPTGWPKFALQTTLEDENYAYLRDNTLFIEANVDSTGLEAH